MLKIAKLSKKRQILRLFSSATPPTPMHSENKDRDLLKAHLIQTMKTFELAQHLKEDINDNFFSRLMTSDTLLNDTLNEYVKSRGTLGRNDDLLSECLQLMASFYSFKGDVFYPSDNRWGKSLFKMDNFQLLLDDIRYFLDPKREFNGKTMEKIIESLKALNYKERSLITAILNRALNEFDASRPNSHSTLIFNQSFSQNLKQVMEEDVLPTSFDQTHVAGPISPEGQEVIAQTESSLAQVKNEMLKTDLMSKQFVEAVTALRNSYFRLKGPEKLQLLKRTPEVYLDFVKIEEKLIELGLLMPLDLISADNTPKSNEIVYRQTALELGFDLGDAPQNKSNLL